MFDAGRRRGVVEEQRAGYDAAVAAYRETVLTAFQQVEDNLAALRVLDAEAAKIQETITASRRALTISTAQYRAGTANYLAVLISQVSELNARRSAVHVDARRLAASVQLIEALGGKW